ncbi:MAG: putative lipopolysaccharide heptosyltransferase III [Candidatus Magnetoovum sp. WYHC-5]|nr:putative lipopolysaccharide heptosyltransferase III [Candidatus Magnetoovum sp. WYHC-5]
MLVTPVIAILKEKYPDAQITALVNAGTEGVLKGNPLLAKVITYDRRTKEFFFVKRYAKELGFLLSLRRGFYDLSIDFTGGDRAALASFISGAAYRIGKKMRHKGFFKKQILYNQCVQLSNRHVVLQNMELLKPLGIAEEGSQPINYAVNFCIPEDVKEKMKRVLFPNTDKLIHVHPVSRWFFKCWRDDYMAECISALICEGYKVVVTSAPDEKEIKRVNSILSFVEKITPHSYRNMVMRLDGKTSIEELSQISSMSMLFFGVDSAPMHIAASVGTPVLALFGPSGAFNWGPWDNDEPPLAQYTKRNGIQISGRHTVIQRNWDCVPCGCDGCDGSKLSKCLYDITPDEVLPIIFEKLRAL